MLCARRFLSTAASAAATGAAATAERSKLQRDGYVVLRNVLDSDLVGEMAAHVEWLQAKYPDVPPEHLHHPLMRNDPFWVRVVSDARLVNKAAELAPFNNGVALFSSHYFCKMPGKGQAVDWHQDGAYWPLEPMDVISLWVAVDHADRENGCLKVVRGSHTQPLRGLRKTPDNVLGSATHSEADFDPADIVYLKLAPGDVSVHHPNIIHASDANRSNRRRCGLTIRYIAPTTRCLDASQPVMMMTTTGEVPGINNYRSWPKYHEGHHMPFKGCEMWNSRRRIVEADEPHFARTDLEQVDKEALKETLDFIRKL